MKRFAFESKVK